MRIVQSNDSFRPIMDGVGVCMENYARHLALQGHEVAVVAPWSPEIKQKQSSKGEGKRPSSDDPFALFRYASLPLPGWKPYRLGTPRLDLNFEHHLHQWTKGEPLDIVHSHSPFVAGRLARRLARHHDALHVTTFHSKYRDDFLKSVPSEGLADLFVASLVRFYESADAVWAPSNGTAETLKAYGFSGEVTVMPNGADLQPPTEAEHAEYRRRGEELLLGADAGSGDRSRAVESGDRGPFILLFVGQHRWEKNLRLVIDGLAALPAERARRVRMVFVGVGGDAEEIQEYAEYHGVRELCDFRGLVVDRELLKSFYARADLFIFPSLYDNAPLVLREAAAFGTPAILAAGSTAAADTVDRRNAYHVRPEPEALSALVARLMGVREEVTEVGARAQKEVYRSWEGIVTEVADRYRSLLEASERKDGQ